MTERARRSGPDGRASGRGPGLQAFCQSLQGLQELVLAGQAARTLLGLGFGLVHAHRLQLYHVEEAIDDGGTLGEPVEDGRAGGLPSYNFV